MRKTPLNILEKLEEFINDFNTLNDETFSIDSIRIEFSKQYKLSPLLELGSWCKIEKNSSLIPKLKKRLTENEITSVYRLEKHNIYYYNKRDSTLKKYRNAELVIFGMKQYHKEPPPREMIVNILSILKNVTSLDVCVDIPYKPNLAKIKQLFTLTPYKTVQGIVTDTSYINTPEITMIEKIVIYNKQIKNNLSFRVWRIEATITVPNVKILALPLYEFKELVDLMRNKQALQIAKEI